MLPISLWYKRVSDEGVTSSTVLINNNALTIPYALGKKNIMPDENIWGQEFYSKAIDNFIDVPVNGLLDPSEKRFFLGSKSMSVPTFFRTSQFSLSEITESNTGISSVSYLLGSSRVSIYTNFDSIISEYLFNAGVFEFFSEIWEKLQTTVNPYDISKEYIERNLVHRFTVESIDVYELNSSVTELVSTSADPASIGFVHVDTIGIQTQQPIFDFSIPTDGSKQIALAFNIKRK